MLYIKEKHIIDDEEFYMQMDLCYEIITISPDSEGGNKYIREIVDYYNNHL